MVSKKRIRLQCAFSFLLVSWDPKVRRFSGPVRSIWEGGGTMRGSVRIQFCVGKSYVHVRVCVCVGVVLGGAMTVRQ